MRNLANFLLFQVAWFACVGGAAEGDMWRGPLATLLVLGLHLAFVTRPGDRVREALFVLVVGVAGFALDSGLHALGLLAYPTSAEAWPHGAVPPWITALWVLFATLPHHSLGWLGGRPRLAFLLGAIGGPLSFLAGTRLGAVGVGTPPLGTWAALTVEYALVTPLLLRFATGAKAEQGVS